VLFEKMRILPLVLVVFVMIFYWAVGGEQFLDPRLYQDYFERYPTSSAIIFFLTFTIGAALALPVISVFAVGSGILFGFWVGVPIALFAGSLGASCGFAVSRYALHDTIQRRYSDHLKVVNRGVEKDGVFYLISMRMIVVIPFGLLNLLMGLTPMRMSRFFVATFLGMMPATLILTYIGSRLGGIQSFKIDQIFTPSLILSLAMLATLPLLVRWFLSIKK
jgi:uncharacterized membrane protein YdjX (TVP38/TMEM64 family)